MSRTLDHETFICLDCETTGLDPKEDRIIEIAVVAFNAKGVIDSFETLVNPLVSIPLSSIEIHNITEDMVKGQPLIEEVLPEVFKIVGQRTIIGHGIGFDLQVITESAKRSGIPNLMENNRSIDTLRLARLYGESPQNSLKALVEHFNIASMGAHRAMGDVLMNIEVFRHLSTKFKTKEELFKRLEKPIEMRRMPLGKHKGRPFKDLPLDYLKWASHQKFDEDLLFLYALKSRDEKRGTHFSSLQTLFTTSEFKKALKIARL